METVRWSMDRKEIDEVVAKFFRENNLSGLTINCVSGSEKGDVIVTIETDQYKIVKN